MKIAVAVLLLLLPGAPAGGQARVVAQSTASARRVARAPRVGEIKDTSEVSKTVSCGFYFQFPKKGEATPDRYVFISQADGQDAWMNLDGRDTRLTLLRISPYPGERLGARRRIDYRAAGGYRVRVLTTVTRLSDENNYDPGQFSVTLTVGRGGRSAVARAVGYAGC